MCGLADHLNGPWATMIRDFAQALAALGYVVLIPEDLSFSGTQPGLEALERMAVKRSPWERALSAAIDESLHRASSTPTHLALPGYSLGGHLCLRLRAAQLTHGTADPTPGELHPYLGAGHGLSRLRSHKQARQLSRSCRLAFPAGNL